MIRLTLFFSRNSLEVWDEVGMFDREVALYEALRDKGVEVHFITYGPNDHQYQERLPGIHIHTNRLVPDGRLYPRLIPLLHAKTLYKTDVIKTNQMKGAKFALSAARLFNKPLIARQGYSWSQFRAQRMQEGNRLSVKSISATEDRVYRAAQRITVSSAQQRDDIIRRIPDSESRINVVPNYVNDNLFTPTEANPIYDLMFVGRLSPQKNVFTLLEAIRNVPDVSLLLVGSGTQDDAVKQVLQSSDLTGRVTHLPRVLHQELPQYLNQSRIFILPSNFEGHPKTLIEAMMCGRPVIGTNVVGIKDVIEHGETGWLCEPTVEGLAEAIQTVLSDGRLREQLGASARQFALHHYALEQIANRELEIIKEVIGL